METGMYYTGIKKEKKVYVISINVKGEQIRLILILKKKNYMYLFHQHCKKALFNFVNLYTGILVELA